MQVGDMLKSAHHVKFMIDKRYYEDFICIALEVKPFKDGDQISGVVGWASMFTKPGEKREILDHADIVVTIFFNDKIYHILCNPQDFEVISHE